MMSPMDEEYDLEPTTPVITEKVLANQPKTKDPHEIDFGHFELAEDESNDTE